MIRAKPSWCTLTVGKRRKRTWANPKKKNGEWKTLLHAHNTCEKKMLKLINKTIIPPLLHSFRALSGKADVADLILTQYRGRVLRDYLYSGHERTSEGGT